MRQFLLLASVLFVSGCAGYASRIREPRNYFESGNYEAAASKLKVLVEANDNDKLLYLMDLGMVYHTARRYPEAIKVFLEAEKLAEINDYTSISQEVGSVIGNDDAKFYRGEDFEKILINVYLALDFTLSGQWDSALVECRKVNHKLDLMISQGQKPYERNAFAKYLAAALFESQGELNSAFVDYRQLRKWRPDTPYLGKALLRVSDRLAASQEFAEYQATYGNETDFRLGKDRGEVVLILEQGKAPLKGPSPHMNLVPIFNRRNYRSQSVILRDGNDKSKSVKSQVLFDIEQTAINELNLRLAAITAKKLGGVAAKVAIGYGVEKATDNKLLGLLARYILLASDKADLRSWTTLPATLQIARLTLPAGRRDLELDMVDRSGGQTRNIARWTGVDVKPGKILFLSYRTPD